MEKSDGQQFFLKKKTDRSAGHEKSSKCLNFYGFLFFAKLFYWFS